MIMLRSPTSKFIMYLSNNIKTSKLRHGGNKEFYFRPEIMVIKISRAFTDKV
jgi:hypothetical protein